MWVRSSGDLSENVYQATTAVSTNCLIYGEVAALVDTGIAALYARLNEQLQNQMGEKRFLHYLLLTHTHFDHVGALPYFRRDYDQAKLIASPACSETLSNREYLLELYRKNAECAAAAGAELDLSEDDWCGAFTVDRILGDGDTLDLGYGVDIKLISTPGHSDDSTSYYVKADLALVCGEAAGSYYGRDNIHSCFMSSHAQYLASLEKLASLDVRILSLAHCGALTGDLASKHLLAARMQAERFAKAIKERLDQGQLVDEIYQTILTEWTHQNISPDGPFIESQTECLRKMIDVVARGV